MPDAIPPPNTADANNVSVGVKPTGRIRKIFVDRATCIGVRSCALIAEKTFFIDKKDVAFVGPNASAYEDDETILKAAQSCPVFAIHLYDQDGKKIFPES